MLSTSTSPGPSPSTSTSTLPPMGQWDDLARSTQAWAATLPAVAIEAKLREWASDLVLVGLDPRRLASIEGVVAAVEALGAASWAVDSDAGRYVRRHVLPSAIRLRATARALMSTATTPHDGEPWAAFPRA